MKRIFLIVALIATVFVKTGLAQTNQKQSLLTSYYDIKNELTNSDATAAAAKSGNFLKVIGSIDAKSFSAAEMKVFKEYQDKLTFDARHMSESKDIAHQREHFASFSANFSKLAKAIKLTDQTVYYDYCPMNKTYWLSAEKEIKNPYYGKQMMDCGKVVSTL
jgi:hypothetical protein